MQTLWLGLLTCAQEVGTGLTSQEWSAGESEPFRPCTGKRCRQRAVDLEPRPGTQGQEVASRGGVRVLAQLASSSPHSKRPLQSPPRAWPLALSRRPEAPKSTKGRGRASEDRKSFTECSPAL